MAKQDYYATLGAAKNASADDLKKAYRKQAMQYHPDRNPGDKAAEAKFKECSEAYEVLKDDQKRAAYDRFGHQAFEGGGGFGGQAGGFDAGGLGDIFDQMFGDFMGKRGGQRTRSGADIQARVELGLSEAFTGIRKQVQVPSRVICEFCHGTGSETRESANHACPTCQGHGKVRAQQGFFLIERTCPTCNGNGKVIRNPCHVCGGGGTQQKERALQVQIPAGVEDGTRIRLAGEGEAGGQGVPPGDLYVHIALKPHAIFQRDGANIFCRVPLRMTQAALGTEVEVPVIDNSRARVKIPAGTGTGDQFRLRGKGFSVLRSASRGDMYIQVSVETPQHMTKRQRELLEEFENEANAKASPEHEGFFAKVREFFEGRS